MLVAVPVPTEMPLPPQPPVLVVSDFLITFLLTEEETKPVSSDIAVGAPLDEVNSLIVFLLIVLLSELLSWIPTLARVEL